MKLFVSNKKSPIVHCRDNAKSFTTQTLRHDVKNIPSSDEFLYIGKMYKGMGESVPPIIQHFQNNDRESNPNRIFKRIERLSRLPTVDQEYLMYMNDKKVQKAYYNLCNGDFAWEHHVRFENDNQKLKVDYFVVKNVDRLAPSSLRGPLLLLGLDVRRFAHDTTKFSAVFSDELSPDQQEYLAHRALHIILRRYGILYLEWTVFHHACLCSMRFWEKNNTASSSLDIAIVNADVAIITKQRTFDKFKSLAIVGDRLLDNNNHDMAARVYLEAAELYAVTCEKRARLYKEAGLAFERVNELGRAEKCYVLAWYFLRGSDLNMELQDGVILRLLLVYRRLALEKRGVFLCTHDRENMEPVLVALLRAADFKARYFGSYREIIFGALPTEHLLRRDLQNKEAAMNALMLATQQPDRYLFRRIILNCQYSERPLQLTTGERFEMSIDHSQALELVLSSCTLKS